MNRMAVGRFWSHGKTNSVLLRPYKGGIISGAPRVYYADEVRSIDEVEFPGKLEFKPIEEELADKLIAEQLSVDAFKPELFHDEVQGSRRAHRGRAEDGRARSSPRPRSQPQAQIIDLFEALKKSLEAGAAGPASKPANEQALKAAADEASDDAKPIKKVTARKPGREKKPATG